MRKFNIFCMMVVSLLLFCSTCVMASENSAVFVVGDEGIYYTGTLVTVPVYLTNNSGFTSVCLEVAFDDDKMELLSVDDFGLLPGANYSTDFSSPYYLRWENSDLDKDIKAEGLVCNLIFYVYEEATGLEFPIILGGLEPEARSAIRSDGSVFECECVDGAIVINILPHEHTYGDWFIGDGYQHLRTCDLCGVDESEDHKWYETERKPATNTEEGYIFYGCEVESCTAEKTEILSILTPSPDNKPQLITLDSQHARQGDTVTLTVSIQDNPGMVDGQLWVKYDEDKFTFQSVTGGKILKNSDIFKSTHTQNTVSILWMYMDFLSGKVCEGDGDILHLTFKVHEDVPDGAYEFTVSSPVLHNLQNEEFLAADTSGNLIVHDGIMGDVNKDGEADEKDETLLKQYFAGYAEAAKLFIDRYAADVNMDGKITRSDLMILSRYFALWEGYALDILIRIP